MAKQNKQPQTSYRPLFGKENYKWTFIGLAVIALGFILMAGGGTHDPKVFDPRIFSFRRIRLAPALVVLGFFIQVYAIMRKPGKQK